MDLTALEFLSVTTIVPDLEESPITPGSSYAPASNRLPDRWLASPPVKFRRTLNGGNISLCCSVFVNVVLLGSLVKVLKIKSCSAVWERARAAEEQERGIETAKMEPQSKFKQITDNQGEHNCGRSVRHVNHDELNIFF
jgi:hypothetical protein